MRVLRLKIFSKNIKKIEKTRIYNETNGQPDYSLAYLEPVIICRRFCCIFDVSAFRRNTVPSSTTRQNMAIRAKLNKIIFFETPSPTLS